MQKTKSFIIRESCFTTSIKQRSMPFSIRRIHDPFATTCVVLQSVPFPFIFHVETVPIMTSAPSKTPKGKGYLRCYIPSSDYAKRLNQKISLASAMDQQGIMYSNELVYRSTCSRKMNNVKFDEQRHLLLVPSPSLCDCRKCVNSIALCTRKR